MRGPYEWKTGVWVICAKIPKLAPRVKGQAANGCLVAHKGLWERKERLELNIWDMLNVFGNASLSCN